MANCGRVFIVQCVNQNANNILTHTLLRRKDIEPVVFQGKLMEIYLHILESTGSSDHEEQFIFIIIQKN